MQKFKSKLMSLAIWSGKEPEDPGTSERRIVRDMIFIRPDKS